MAAIVVMFALRQASKRHRLQLEQRERHQQELRDDERHAAAVKECRERLAWVVDKGTIEPSASEHATLGFGPELALTVLQGIAREARQLDDATLAAAAAVQLNQFSLVLTQQGSLLSTFSEAARADVADTEKDQQSVSQAAMHTPAGEASDETTPPAHKVATGGRRRRR